MLFVTLSTTILSVRVLRDMRAPQEWSVDLELPLWKYHGPNVWITATALTTKHVSIKNVLTHAEKIQMHVRETQNVASNSTAQRAHVETDTQETLKVIVMKVR